MRRFLGKPEFCPNLLEACLKGEVILDNEPQPEDRSPGWKARAKKKQKEEFQKIEEWEKHLADRKKSLAERKKRDDLERQLRDQREREGRALSLIVPTQGGGDGPRAPQADLGSMPGPEGRPSAEQEWGQPTRPEYRVELDASSSRRHAARLLELSASSASEPFSPDSQSGQRPAVHQGQQRRNTQRFELTGNFPGEHSRSPQPPAGRHPGSYQQGYCPVAQPQPQERQRDQVPCPPQVMTGGQRTRRQAPVHYPPGFFENPRTPPDISKYDRPPAEPKTRY